MPTSRSPSRSIERAPLHGGRGVVTLLWTLARRFCHLEIIRHHLCLSETMCPAVLMAQATEDRYRSDSSNPLDGAGEGSVLLQR